MHGFFFLVVLQRQTSLANCIVYITEPRSCMGSTWSAFKQCNLHRIDYISIDIANRRWCALSSWYWNLKEIVCDLLILVSYLNYVPTLLLHHHSKIFDA